MATRKDKRGYALYRGESQRKDGRYSFSYTDMNRKRHTIYANDLTKLRLREKKIKKDLEEHRDPFIGEKLSVSDLCRKYLETKREIRESTLVNYYYTLEHIIEPNIGGWKIARIRPSDLESFYFDLLDDGVKGSTVDNVHTIIHPAFSFAISEGFLSQNPAVGLMKKVKKSDKYVREKRFALTKPQQEKFVTFLNTHPEYASWKNLFIAFLGTGCRMAELTGLTWNDINFDTNIIDINHQMTYHKHMDGKCYFECTSLLKTNDSKRTIPLFPSVREALLDEYCVNKTIGFSKYENGGYSNFVFTTYDGMPYTPSAINEAIERVRVACNKEETELAKKENREPVLIPHFSCHSFRHTFCTRLCEVETNLKVIMSIMGHSDISTTMNIYAECTAEKKQEAAIELSETLYIC